MNKCYKKTLKVRLIKLAALKSTGAPADLALRFEISERSVKDCPRDPGGGDRFALQSVAEIVCDRQKLSIICCITYGLSIFLSPSFFKIVL